MDILAFLYIIAERVPNITLANALGLADDAQRLAGKALADNVDVDNLRSMVLAARANAEVMAEATSGRKIQAIKALRVATNSGLLEAKNAVDYIVSNLPHMTCLPDPSVKANGRL